MKNIKLLIATTAMLSAGLMTDAMAEKITTNFNVGVSLLDAWDALTKVQDLNFGVVQFNGDHDADAGKTVILAPDGKVSGTAVQYGGEQVAIIRSSTNDSHYNITVSGDDKLYGEVNGEQKLCGHVSDWTHDSVEGTRNFRIGATFTLPSQEEYSSSIGPSVDISRTIPCTGVATATSVYISD